MLKITNVYQLMEAHKNACPNSHYFDEDTLKFFGECLSRMNVLKNTVEVKDISGERHICYILSKLSRRFDGKRVRTYGYFDVENLHEVIV